jgi:citrate lyase beta subunit
MMQRAAATEADEVFLDLEDACAPSEKKDARALAIRALNEQNWGTKLRAVRVNGVTTRWCYADLVEVMRGAGDRVDAIVVPKIDDASQVHFVDHLLSQIEADLTISNPVAIELQIESPAGMINLREIVRSSSRIEAVIFGPGDYAASLGVPNLDIGASDDRYLGHQWHWALSEIANHAKAAGVQAIDGPVADFQEPAAYMQAALLARLLGFEGKWCIHPNQIAWANEAFSSTAAELHAARRLLEEYDRASAQGLGAIAIDGKLVDEASRKAAETTLARAPRAPASTT